MITVRFDTKNASGVVGLFDDGGRVPVERSRSRAYPGLVAEAPSTAAYYELACEELAGSRRVLDFGSGSGAGSAILSGSFEEVVGVDRDEKAVLFARRFAQTAIFAAADLAGYEGVAPFDAAVVVDVLGHLQTPYDALRMLRRSLREGAKILVAEASAYPSQSLRTPARRAFSPRTLRSLLAASGFEVDHWQGGEGSFVVCVARAVADGPAQELAKSSQGSIDLLHALSCSEETPRAIRVEAALSLADLLLSQGDGDRSAEAYFLARELDPADPRPLAGLSQLSLAIGQAKDALSLSTMALRLDATDLSAASVHAMALEAMLPESSLPAWRAAVNLAPDHPAIVGRFVEAAVALGEFPSALLALEKLRSYGDSLGTGFHLLTASVFLAAGRRADAVLEARLAVAGAPNDPNAKAFWERLNAA